MKFAAIWMDPGLIILSIVNQRKINIVSLNMWNLKKIQMNLFTKQIDPQTETTNLWLPKERRGKDKLGVWD